ncbi:MAG: helix-turn-helix domain-containing protein [Gammaproteobacteria bacterium]|jgi:predicted transcriptional regulator
MENTIVLERFLANELDLSNKEIMLYLNLVKYGARTIQELAELSNINRVTTHNNVENLTQKGLVTQVKKGRGSRRLIMAEPPEKLSVIFKERQAKIIAAEKQLDLITKELLNLKKEYNVRENVEVHQYKGKEEVKLIYNDVLSSKEIRSYVNCNEVTRIFPTNVSKFINSYKRNPNMQIWEIMEKSEEAKKYVEQVSAERYRCRLTNKQLNLASLDYLIYDGKVAVVEFDAIEGVRGIVIENKKFYENAKAIHQFVWQFLPAQMDN